MTDFRSIALGEFLKVRHGKSQRDVETPTGRFPILGTGGQIGRTDTPLYNRASVLIGRKGTIDRPQFLDSPFWTVDTLFYTEIDLVLADPKYVYYQFLTIPWASFNEASGVPSLSSRRVEQVKIPLPDVGTQRRISSVLSDVDELASSLERLLAKKQAIKQGMMMELLSGRTRLPSFTGQWEVLSLGSVAQMGSGGTPPSSVERYYGGAIPWVSISDMTRAGKYLERTAVTLSAEGLSASAAKLYEPNVVLYAMYASLGECSIAVGRVTSSQAILGIDAGPKLDREFLYYYLLSIKPRVKLLGQQGTQSNLNAGMVRSFELRLPPLDEQRAISAALADADLELRALERRLESTRLIKQGMMQELLSGRTRLTPAEVAA